jgi:hypothetical protein
LRAQTIMVSWLQHCYGIGPSTFSRAWQTADRDPLNKRNEMGQNLCPFRLNSYPSQSSSQIKIVPTMRYTCDLTWGMRMGISSLAAMSPSGMAYA